MVKSADIQNDYLPHPHTKKGKSMIKKSKFASLLSAVLAVSMIAGCGSSSAASSAAETAAETTAAAADSSSSGTEESPAATEAAASEAPVLEPQQESADLALITHQDVEAAGLTLHNADIGYRFNSDDTTHDLKMASGVLLSEYGEEAGIAWQGYKDESGLHCVNFVMPFGSVNFDTEGEADDLIDSASQYLKGDAAAWLANIKSEIDSGAASLDETYENGTFSKYENGRFSMYAVITYQGAFELRIRSIGDNASLFDNFLSEEQFDELAH